jgi:hypothetical protein
VPPEAWRGLAPGRGAPRRRRSNRSREWCGCDRCIEVSFICLSNVLVKTLHSVRLDTFGDGRLAEEICLPSETRTSMTKMMTRTRKQLAALRHLQPSTFNLQLFP